ncbi:DUF2523 family protein [Thauera sp. Sel9]|uniref:DUF2523 family protein n=1 Tax=Thauera sp. Sel9 TaxID=2974299 RepID=UPI0021E114C3|nr:DUF2523 family protein [Thauera sp. Sel9]MCV2216868.1 DUF2523 domain-containing protein [Thauera sp. Sel9]
MALPLVVSAGIGALLSGLIGAVVSNAGRLLVAFGITLISVKGIETVVGYLVHDIALIGSAFNWSGGSGSNFGNFGAAMMQLAVYAGLFDVINILISGYMAIASLKMFRTYVGRMK